MRMYLHGYVDGQLDDARRLEVQRYLEANPDSAQLVAAYQAQREAIRAAFAGPSQRPLPAQLSLARIIAERDRRVRTPWLLAASVVLALGLGLTGGWFLRGFPEQGRTERAMALLGQEALASHVVYSVDLRHPVGGPGRRGAAFAAMALEAARPGRGGTRSHDIRLSADWRQAARDRARRGAALLMYDDANHHRISVLLRPYWARSFRRREQRSRRMRPPAEPGSPNGLGVAVVAAMPETDIRPWRSRSHGSGDARLVVHLRKMSDSRY